MPVAHPWLQALKRLGDQLAEEAAHAPKDEVQLLWEHHRRQHLGAAEAPSHKLSVSMPFQDRRSNVDSRALHQVLRTQKAMVAPPLLACATCLQSS